MWQVQYDLHRLRMRELEAEADQRRRWHLEDGWNGRAEAIERRPNQVRVRAARAAAALSRAAARFAVRLDGRVVPEAGPERLLHDA